MSNKSWSSMPMSISTRSKSSRADNEAVAFPEIDPYIILGLSQNAARCEIRKSYLRLSLLYHPNRKRSKTDDLNNEDIEINKKIREWKFIVVAGSFETLSNAEYRRNYNIQRRQQKSAIKKIGFWDEIKSGLQISDSHEQRHLDHEGVDCCGDESIMRRIAAGFKMYDYDNEEDERDDAEDNNNFSGNCKLLRNRPRTIDESDREVSSKSTHSECSQNGERQETHHLFGGVLSGLYRARCHEPFTDAFDLFRYETGTSIYHGKLQASKGTDGESDMIESDSITRNRLITSLWRKDTILQLTSADGIISQMTTMSHDSDCICKDARLNKGYPSLPVLPRQILDHLCEGKWENNQTELDEFGSSASAIKVSSTFEKMQGRKMKVTKKIRCVGTESIVRTETITKDPWTGKKKTVVEVKRIPMIDVDQTVETDCDTVLSSSSSVWSSADSSAKICSCLPHSLGGFVGDTLGMFDCSDNERNSHNLRHGTEM
mmetsp:Transcript_13530/g.20125  ORF Transcript_13530/g.20125 Transcript_13530/m.20125 type:complete len:488 (+) Transcript_13530:1-1464(+)